MLVVLSSYFSEFINFVSFKLEENYELIVSAATQVHQNIDKGTLFFLSVISIVLFMLYTTVWCHE